VTLAFDDEFMGPLTGALSGGAVDVTTDFDPTMDFWGQKQWLVPGRRPPKEDPLTRLVTGFVDDGDPAHEEADRRAKVAGVDVYGTNNDLLSIARSQLGSPYIWADSDPKGGGSTGFDCSGFTQWVLSRFGISTPHLSSAQQDQFKPVSKENLQPGDLVFFHYSDRNGPGNTADHVGLYIGNGRMIAASSSNDAVVEQGVDWDNFVGGGATGIDAASGVAPERRGRGFRRKGAGATEPALEDLTMVPYALAPGGLDGTGLPSPYAGGLPHIMGDMLMPTKMPGTTRSFNGSNGSINRQLYKGFMDAGRPDLAKMVGTPAFTTWVNAESGYNPSATSPANNNGLANDGLFQVWRGHDFNSDGQVAGMSPYQQAQIVAKYFDLSADDIRRYATSIHDGSYSGWG
jgi:hypothetical protein